MGAFYHGWFLAAEPLPTRFRLRHVDNEACRLRGAGDLDQPFRLGCKSTKQLQFSVSRHEGIAPSSIFHRIFGRHARRLRTGLHLLAEAKKRICRRCWNGGASGRLLQPPCRFALDREFRSKGSHLYRLLIFSVHFRLRLTIRRSRPSTAVSFTNDTRQIQTGGRNICPFIRARLIQTPGTCCTLTARLWTR